jgi:hypothetical protein
VSEPVSPFQDRRPDGRVVLLTVLLLQTIPNISPGMESEVHLHGISMSVLARNRSLVEGDSVDFGHTAGQISDHARLA